MKSSKRFYEILFDAGEYTCFAPNKFGTKTYSALSKGPKEETEFFSINPHVKGSTRAGSNISSFRNILIEIDKDSNGEIIPRETQLKMFDDLNVPFATMVWSGSKSFHAIISIAGGFEDRAHYSQAVAACYRVLQKNGVPNDEQVKDPSRLSRAANGLRFNKLQEIEELRHRITLHQFEKWLEKFGEKIEEPIYHMRNVDAPTGTSNATFQDKVDFVLKHKMSAPTLGDDVDGNHNNWQVVFCRFLRATGLSQHEVATALRESCPHIDHRKPDERAFKSDFDSDDSIYVYTKQERINYMNDLNSEERKAQRLSRLNAGTTPDIDIDSFLLTDNKTTKAPSVNGREWMADHMNYVFVGNEYYAKTFNKPGDLLMMKTATLKNRYGFTDGDLSEIPSYQKFTVKPGHVDFQQVVDGVFWNRYREVDWSPKAGGFKDCLYILKMLKHLFGKNDVDPNQIEEILDWLTILIKHPEVKLHQILLYSQEQGTSKTAFGKLIGWMLQENYIQVKSSDMEEKFNGHWIDKLVVHIDEGNFTKPKEMANNLKNWGTADTVNLRLMGSDYTTVPFFAKFVITTNESEGLFVQEEDRRIWARNAQVIPEKDKASNYEDRMKAEVPYFLHLLLNRKLKHPTSQGPLYLPDTVVKTGAKLNLAYDNKTDLEQRILDIVQLWFTHKKNEDTDVLYCTPNDIITVLRLQDGYSDQKVSSKAVGKILRSELKCKAPSGTTSRIGGFTAHVEPTTQKWYEIYRVNVKNLEEVSVFDVNTALQRI